MSRAADIKPWIVETFRYHRDHAKEASEARRRLSKTARGAHRAALLALAEADVEVAAIYERKLAELERKMMMTNAEKKT